MILHVLFSSGLGSSNLKIDPKMTNQHLDGSWLVSDCTESSYKEHLQLIRINVKPSFLK